MALPEASLFKKGMRLLNKYVQNYSTVVLEWTDSFGEQILSLTAYYYVSIPPCFCVYYVPLCRVSRLKSESRLMYDSVHALYVLAGLYIRYVHIEGNLHQI